MNGLKKFACSEGKKVYVNLGNALIFVNRSVVGLEFEFGTVHFVIMTCACRHSLGCVAQSDWNVPGDKQVSGVA